MASARDIRRRIKSVKTTAQMTKAMQMIAATRMQRAQRRVLAARPYADKIQEVLSALASQGSSVGHPLLTQRDPRNVAVITVGASRGLCGPLISNLNRMISRFVLGQKNPVKVIPVGRKARDFGLRAGLPLIGEFSQMPTQPSLSDTSAIARLAMDEYIAGRIDTVHLAYTKFVSTLNQQPVMVQILPIIPPPQEQAAGLTAEYEYEPEASDVLNELLPRYVEVLVYQAVLESQASEESARMVAMRNATDNAKELVKDLTLTLNKARQAGITREIAEISAGASALSE